MKYRGLVLYVGAVAAVVAVMSVPMAGQASRRAGTAGAPEKTSWTQPRTAWGDPDFNGLWQAETGVPLERPARFQGREFLTDEEIAAKKKAAEELQNKTAAGNVYEFAFRSQANLNAIFHYDEVLAPIARRTSLIIDPPNGRLPLLTPAAVKLWETQEATSHGRGESDSYIDRGLGERCINLFEPGRVGYWGLGSPAVPRPVKYAASSVSDPTLGGADTSARDDTERASGEPDRPLQRILQGPGFFAVVHMDSQGFRASYRVIPLDQRPHFGPKVRQFQGDGRGHWEGNTLVVETTNLNEPDPMFATYGQSRYPGTRETLRVIERYTRIDADQLEYRYTVDDPATYTRPYTVLQSLTRNDNFAVPPELCHENQKDLGAQLAAARADEAAAMDMGSEFEAARQQRLDEIKAEVAAAQKSR